MPRLPFYKATVWGRLLWFAQITAAGIRELEPHERRRAREILSKLARERRLSAKEREHLRRLAGKAGKGAALGARGASRKRR